MITGEEWAWREDRKSLETDAGRVVLLIAGLGSRPHPEDARAIAAVPVMVRALRKLREWRANRATWEEVVDAAEVALGEAEGR